ncbi:phospholipid carrier-dependent glycosyltransferase [Novosphingobium aerophilum]|uniref:phospholipid carrier-dependent glycosyltransferase n=1 Tax=Novosphingobium TaxID=165696 RepID=UPI002D794BE1|nr:phospholipid carrier-dependent glycosyltransferase [Novosphingobium sp. RL4]WRT92232.1 phospholipid carrier-dependent glycosyltransferase [Novosphingobium sp. RL4]
MPTVSRNDRDPIGWSLIVTGLFLALALFRISEPGRYYFDEIHYVPAALKLLDMVPANREHPMFAKEVIAGFIALIGDRPFAWRIGPVLFGTLGLLAFSRFIWLISGRRRAAITATVLLATNFTWFVQSRIAMLDMVEASLCMVGLWQFAAALRSGSAGAARARLAMTGIALGLSLGAKWSSAPALAIPGLWFLALRIRENGWKIVGSRKAGPIPGISLIEAGFWLGLLPLAVYWATYLPAMFYSVRPVSPWGFIEQHRHMIALQDSVKKLHPYRSQWYQWMVDWRPIWYQFESIDGRQHGIVMLGNPFSMIAGLFALIWSIWAATFRRRSELTVLIALYAGTLGMWIVNGKPIQFYYHYLLPGAFLMAILAFALDALWDRRDKWRRAGTIAMWGSVGMFVLFYPIISGAPLPTKEFYNFWMWLPNWR